MFYSLLGCLITAIGVNAGLVAVHLFSTSITGVGGELLAIILLHYRYFLNCYTRFATGPPSVARIFN